MKIKLILLLLLLYVPSAQSQIQQSDNCSTKDNIIHLISRIDDILWKPQFDPNCSPQKMSDECQNLKSDLENHKKDWKSYLKVCEKENELASYALSCTQFLRNSAVTMKEFWLSMVDHNIEEIDRAMDDNQCSKDQESKKRIIEEYNNMMPRILKFQVTSLQKNLLQRKCSEIKGFLKGYQREMQAKGIMAFPEPVELNTISEEGLEFLIWKKNMESKILQQENAYQTVKKYLEKEFKNFSCLSNYRKTEILCETTLAVIFPYRKAIQSNIMQRIRNGYKKTFKETEMPEEHISLLFPEEKQAPYLNIRVLNKIEEEYSVLIQQEKKIIADRIGSDIRYEFQNKDGKKIEIKGKIKGAKNNGFLLEFTNSQNETSVITVPYSASYKY